MISIHCFFFSAAIGFTEYLRSKILTGFPWNLWAYSTSSFNEILQIINLIGLYSYNLLVITFFTLPIIFFFKISSVKKTLISLTIILILLFLHIFGNYQINKNNKLLKSVENKTLVKIISPNFDLKYGLNKDEIEVRLKKLIRYSDPIKDKKTLFIWPEGVFSGYSYNEVAIFKELISRNFSKNHFILFGVNKLEKESGNFYNSMLIVNNNFEILQSYNKRKLVPFGEFLPFESLLSNFGLKKDYGRPWFFSQRF